MGVPKLNSKAHAFHIEGHRFNNPASPIEPQEKPFAAWNTEEPAEPENIDLARSFAWLSLGQLSYIH